MCKKNGIVKGVYVDEKLKKYIYDDFMIWKKGQVITNHLSESLGFYFMSFNSKEEMEDVMLNHYNDIYAIQE